MKMNNILWINVKKLKTRTKQALFLIVPMGILMAMSVVVSSQVTNIQSAVNESVFGTIEEQNTLIELTIEEDSSIESQMMKNFLNTSSLEEENFSEIDTQIISDINGVESVNLLVKIPVSNIVVEDLFEEYSFDINSMVGMDDISAALYTEETFDYVEGEPIPIILNANSFIYQYEDWGGEDVITVDMTSALADPGTARQRFSPVKSEAIDYNRNDLLGETFTLSVGGFDSIPTFRIEKDGISPSIVKLTADEIETLESDREESISQYWDYDLVSEKITYDFVVVGVIEDASTLVTYVPEVFGNIVMSETFAKQIEARNDTEIPVELLNTDYLGLTYDGAELTTGTSSMFGQAMKMGGGMGRSTESSSTAMSMVSIPGLVIETDDAGGVLGTYEGTKVYEESEKYSKVMSIKIDEILNRENVIEALNDSGYAYQDVSDMDVFAELEDTLSMISTVFIISFIVLIAGIVIMTMSKLISESIKEIGIFRAIGFTKNSISILFILQSLLYVMIGYVIGILLGIGLNFITASGMSAWFSNFIDTTISQSYNVVNVVDSGVFMNIDWSAIMTYSILIVVISLVVSFVPARQASNISPVEAIKSE